MVKKMSQLLKKYSKFFKTFEHDVTFCPIFNKKNIKYLQFTKTINQRALDQLKGSLNSL